MSISKLIKIAAALFAAGVILFFVGSLFGGKGVFINSKFQMVVPDDSDYYEYENRDLEAFTSVNIDVRNMPVTFFPSDNGSYGVELAYYATDKDNMLIEVKDGMLKVKSKSEMRWLSFDLSFLNGTKRNKEYVIVYLPKQEYETIDAFTSNGAIIMEKADFAAKTLLLDTSNAPIMVSGIKADMVTTDTSNGTVNLSGVVSEKIRVETSNAPVTVSDCAASKFEISTSNGQVHLEKLTFEDGERDVSVKTSNGGISAEFPECRETDFRIHADTSNANIYVNGENMRDNEYSTKNGEGRLRLDTSNSRIEMYFGLD